MALSHIAIFLVLLALSVVEASNMYAWGVNDYGQLGINGSFTIRFPTLIPTYTNADIVDLKASGTYHMAIASNGDVYVCGNNWYGALGLPIPSGIFVATPQKNPSLKSCKIYLGRRHGNAVCGNQFVGWGVQSGYVRGISTGNYGIVNASTPSYQLGVNVLDVLAGSKFSLLSLSNETQVIAGSGESGILGLGDTQPRNKFVRFDAFDNNPVHKIFPSHADHVCAISATYSLYCWGSNIVGQLGVGHTQNLTRPTLVSFFEQEHYVVQVATGEFHTLALTASGRVFAWGMAANGVLGNGVFDNSTFSTPMEVEFLADKNIVEIVAGLNFNYVRTSENQWYSWGAGYGGVLGTQSDDDVSKPTLVQFLSNFKITKILTASTSRSLYGWLDPAAPTTIPDLPPLVNECLTSGLIKCEANAHCVDTDRYATCACDSGFEGNAANCQNINECLTSVCVPSAVCTDTPGSFTCTCPTDKPLGDGKSTGTGCAPLPTPPPTKPPTKPPTLPPTLPPTEAPTMAPNSSSSDENSTDTTTGQTTNSTVPTDGTDSSSTQQATGGPVGVSVSTTGADSNQGSTTSDQGDSGSQSTTGRTNAYQTLGGALDQISKPAQTTATSDDAIINPNNSSKRNYDKDVMIGVLVAFVALILLVILIGAIVIYRARRPTTY